MKAKRECKLGQITFEFLPARERIKLKIHTSKGLVEKELSSIETTGLLLWLDNWIYRKNTGKDLTHGQLP